MNNEPAEHPGLTPRFVLLLAGVMLLDHLLTWMIASRLSGVSMAAALGNYDSGWYNSIISEGYAGKRYAFFPLYPMLVKGLQCLTGGWFAPQVAGTVLSTMLFAVLCVWVARLASGEGAGKLLAPKTAFGWFCFVYAPASFVFHSHHTESLFVLLSLAAFFFAGSGRWLWAAILAGLCGLTRIQGYFVMTAVALAALLAGGGMRRRLGNCALVSLVSGALAAIYPVFQFVRTGNALAFVSSQASWNHPTATAAIYLKTFLLANPWQNHNVGSILHLGFVAALLFSLWLMRRASPPLLAYVSLSVIVMPMEGELVNAFRFGAVLFPALYALGDWADRRALWMKACAAAAILALNHWVTVNYLIKHWAY